MTAERARASGVLWVGFGLLIAAFALDFHLDTRERDLFSWMDPYQHYEFSLGVLEGTTSFDAFEIPSIFPFFVLPFLALDPSIPGSLWVQFAGMLVMLFGVHRLCCELEIRTPSPLVALLLLSSPILIGLARTLYVEFTLTALASIVFLLWLRLLRSMDRRAALAFAIAMGVAFMTKITFPLFMVGPVAGAVVARLAERRTREAVALAMAAIVPIAGAILIHIAVFPPSLGYYINLVSTARPFMFLMGPPDTASWASATYYFVEVGRSFLFLLTPLLAIPVLSALRGVAGFRWSLLASPRAGLWLWLVGPLVLLIAHPLKEPRHAAACVVPAVLLIVLGIEALPRRGVRAALTTMALTLAGVQFTAVTRGWIEKPYFLDGPLHYEELRSRMMAASRDGPYRHTPPELKRLHWSYDQNVAIVGFPANEALALTWQGFPGVAFDLETYEDPARLDDRIADQAFEDLFFLAGINTYNRRCGWWHYHRMLSRETVLANADFLIVNAGDRDELARRFPQHALFASIEREGGPIQLLQAKRATTPYRALYARRFLERNPSLPPQEVRTVAEELLISSVLAGNASRIRSLQREFPVLRDPSVAARNIYWIGGYPALLDLTRKRIDALSRAKGP